MAFNASIFAGMGEAARQKQTQDREQRTNLLSTLNDVYAKLEKDPRWASDDQQRLLHQAYIDINFADPGDRKSSSKVINKWSNLFKVGALPDTPPTQQQGPPRGEGGVASGEAPPIPSIDLQSGRAQPLPRSCGPPRLVEPEIPVVPDSRVELAPPILDPVPASQQPLYPAGAASPLLYDEMTELLNTRRRQGVTAELDLALEVLNLAQAAGADTDLTQAYQMVRNETMTRVPPDVMDLLWAPGVGVINTKTGELLYKVPPPQPESRPLQRVSGLAYGEAGNYVFDPSTGKILDSEGNDVSHGFVETVATPELQRVQTMDADGNAITMFVSPSLGEVFAAPPTADMRNRAIGRQNALVSIDALQDLSEKLHTEPTTIEQIRKSLMSGVQAITIGNPEFQTYQAARSALAGNLAVAQQGARPSDADIERVWLPLVPSLYTDNAETAQMKWGFVREMALVTGLDQSAIEDMVIDLEGLDAEAIARLAASQGVTVDELINSVNAAGLEAPQ